MTPGQLPRCWAHRHALLRIGDHGEGWWSKTKDRHWNGCGTERLLRTCKSGHVGEMSRTTRARAGEFGVLGVSWLGTAAGRRVVARAVGSPLATGVSQGDFVRCSQPMFTVAP
jgi:hypothetical protein